MYCLTCQYDLQGLARRRCPECGNTFDPTDPETFAYAPRRPRRMSFRLLAVLLFYPIMPLTLIYATWLAAGITLGHAPRPSLDDPGALAGAPSVMHSVSQVALLGMATYVPLIPTLLIGYLLFGRDKYRSLRTLILLATYALLLGAWIIALRSSTLIKTIMIWFMD
jgi:hypothetical protein